MGFHAAAWGGPRSAQSPWRATFSHSLVIHTTNSTINQWRYEVNMSHTLDENVTELTKALSKLSCYYIFINEVNFIWMIRKHTCKVETRLRVCFNYPQSKSTTYQAALPNHPLATAQTTVPQTLRLPASVSRPSAAHSKLCLCSSVQDNPQITSRLSWPR